jgi:hypothetical protein
LTTEVAAIFRATEPEPGAAIVAGAKDDVAPVGKPAMENVTAELKPAFVAVVRVT